MMKNIFPINNKMLGAKSHSGNASLEKQLEKVTYHSLVNDLEELEKKCDVINNLAEQVDVEKINKKYHIDTIHKICNKMFYICGAVSIYEFFFSGINSGFLLSWLSSSIALIGILSLTDWRQKFVCNKNVRYKKDLYLLLEKELIEWAQEKDLAVALVTLFNKEIQSHTHEPSYVTTLKNKLGSFVSKVISRRSEVTTTDTMIEKSISSNNKSVYFYLGMSEYYKDYKFLKEEKKRAILHKEKYNKNLFKKGENMLEKIKGKL